MTIEQFFKNFEIEPFYDYMVRVQTGKDTYTDYQCSKNDLKKFFYKFKNFKVIRVMKKYPEINELVLLRLIVILSHTYNLNYEGWSFDNVEQLREDVLLDLIRNKSKCFKEVRQFFSIGRVLNEEEI